MLYALPGLPQSDTFAIILSVYPFVRIGLFMLFRPMAIKSKIVVRNWQIVGITWRTQVLLEHNFDNGKVALQLTLLQQGKREQNRKQRTKTKKIKKIVYLPHCAVLRFSYG